jgi:hypothetical protein
MANSYQQYVADGATQNFSVPFPYIAQAHVVVKRNQTLLEVDVGYSWLNSGTIRLTDLPASGDVIEVRRVTPLDAPLVEFQNGAVLTEAELNLAVRQNLYATQEIVDYYEASLSGGVARIASAGGAIAATTQELIDAAVQELLATSLAADLQARITDIDENAESIVDQALRLTTVEQAVDALTDPGGGGIVTLINNETAARIAGDTAIVADIALIGAKNGANNAFVLDLDTVLVGASESLGTRLSTISSTLGGHTTTIATQQTVLNGVIGQYMVKIDSNGHVAGFGLYNDGGSSQFIVNANKFAVTDGTTSKVPFIVSGGVCYMQNVVIQDALIANLTVGKLTSGTLTATITQNADINVGTGRIVFDNGTYMKVQGVNFGASNDLIEWYGPRPAGGNIALCTKAAAIYYLDNSGDAYFGGSLSAGTLKNSIQTSDTSASAQVTLGPFGTNGNTKSVVFSYSLTQHRTLVGYGNSSGSTSGTLTIYRKIGTAAEASWYVLSLTGGYQTVNETEPGVDDWGEQTLAGSITLSDSASPTTDDRTYRAALTARSIQAWGTTGMQQRISIISTEE